MEFAWAALRIGVGLVLVLIALLDAFLTLWRPTGFSRLSWRVARVVWRSCRWLDRRSRGWLDLAGPFVILLTAVTWGTLIVVGAALVYWPLLPGGFLVAPGLPAGEDHGPVAALYVSLVTFATLGYGDFAPVHPALRILAPMQAVLGFVIFTAVVSWIVSVYPATARQRALAREIRLLADVASDARKTAPAQAVGDHLLASLTTRVMSARGDFVQFPATYYFRPTDERSALPLALPHLVELARRAAAAEAFATAFHGRALQRALAELLDLVGAQYLRHRGGVEDTIEAYRRDHAWPDADRGSGRSGNGAIASS